MNPIGGPAAILDSAGSLEQLDPLPGRREALQGSRPLVPGERLFSRYRQRAAPLDRVKWRCHQAPLSIDCRPMMRPTLAGLVLVGLALHSCGSASRSTLSSNPPCIVDRIADGDTFSCRDRRRVRLLGIDSPELGQGEAGRQAQAALQRLLPSGATVRLEWDVAPRDRYGRELAYVWTGSRMVNEVLVREGWAVLYTLPPNVKYAERLERAQKTARAAGAGLWGSRAFECPPSAWRRRRCSSLTPLPDEPAADR
jgi:micrococcal nuclease